MNPVERPTQGRRVGLPLYLTAAIALLAVMALPGAAGAQQWTSCGTNGICNTNSGNVGVGTGTNAPSTALEVGRNAAGAPTGLMITAGSTVAAPVLYFNYADAGANLKRWGVFGDIQGGFNVGTQPDAGGGLSAKLFISNAGNVGFGTTSPGAKLDVYKPTSGTYNASTVAALFGNSAGADSLYVIGNTLNGVYNSAGNGADLWLNYRGHQGGTTYDRNLRIGDGKGNAIMSVIGGSGNVGIGTASPTQLLDVSGTGDVKARAAGTNSAAVMLQEGFGTTTWSEWQQYGDRLRLNTSDGTTVRGDVISVLPGGNVGIGNQSPAYTLDVSGTAHVTGNMTVDGQLNAKYQDVAEWVPSSQKLSAGTVVVLDTARSNHVLASTKAYDTGVAGVISDSPGVILGQGGDGKVKVATTGRVKIKVDATRAPIKVGDLLVTSGVEGVAMKSIPVDIGGAQLHRPGTIIGKALEPLEKGTGEILVLLSLQ